MLRKFVIRRKVFFQILNLQIPDIDDKKKEPIFTSGGDYQQDSRDVRYSTSIVSHISKRSGRAFQRQCSADAELLKVFKIQTKHKGLYKCFLKQQRWEEGQCNIFYMKVTTIMKQILYVSVQESIGQSRSLSTKKKPEGKYHQGL